jgi:hypothetical protein
MSLLDTASLIVTPNAYKEGKLYSVIPSDGSGDMSVVRATTATRVNSAGLVELVPYNLVQYSETFASPWGALSGASVSANTAVSPNGQNTAATFSVTSTAFSGFIQTLGSSAQNISIYAKKGTLDYLWIVNESISAIGASYNLDTGAVTYTASGHTASIESVGNGWYRCTISHPTNGWEYMQFGLSNASNSGSSPSGGNAYIWGAQAVEGSTALPYLKTETRLNIPRLDYSNGTCPSLLVEPQRTNLARYSSSFDNAAWVKLNLSITSNNAIAPDGTLTADKSTPNTVSGGHYFRQTVSVSIGTTYTATIYAKAAGYNFMYIYAKGTGNNQYRVFDLQNGTLGISSGTQNSSIESVGNGWYRCVLTWTQASISSIDIEVATLSSNSVGAFAGDGISGIYAWGAQLELGSYSTSYIPTTSASVTRNADVISKTGISSLIGQTEGVVFLDFVYTELDSNGLIPITIGSNSSPNHMYYFIEGNERINFDFIVGGTDVLSIQTAVGFAVKGTRYKIALAYKANDFAVYINGVLIGTQNSGAITGFDDFYFGYPYASGYSYPNRYNAAALWQTRLTNTQLAQLTTI